MNLYNLKTGEEMRFTCDKETALFSAHAMENNLMSQFINSYWKLPNVEIIESKNFLSLGDWIVKK